MTMVLQRSIVVVVVSDAVFVADIAVDNDAVGLGGSNYCCAVVVVVFAVVVVL